MRRTPARSTLPLVALCAVLPALALPGVAMLVDSDGEAGDHLGLSGLAADYVSGPAVAVSGDVLVAGAPDDAAHGHVGAGSVVVYRRQDGTWALEQKLATAIPSDFGAFGVSVDVDGDVVVVGLPFGGFGLGESARVYRHGGAGWALESVLDSGTSLGFEVFGAAVAVSGDVIVVGSPYGHGTTVVQPGNARVFRWDGADWVPEAVLTAAGGATGDAFGSSVTIDGDVIVVGSPFDGLPGVGARAGSATAFRWDGAAWNEEQVLTAGTASSVDDWFGAAVSVSGDLLAVGAPFDDAPSTGTDGGTALVYRWDGASWVEEQRLLGPGGKARDSFGASVAVSGQRIAVGAPFDDRLGDDAGAAAVFAWNGGTWELETLLLPPARAAGDAFGVSLAMGDGTVAVGAPFRDVHGAVDQGMVYVFTP